MPKPGRLVPEFLDKIAVFVKILNPPPRVDVLTKILSIKAYIEVARAIASGDSSPLAIHAHPHSALNKW